MSKAKELLDKVPKPSQEIRSGTLKMSHYLTAIEALQKDGVGHAAIASYLIAEGILNSFTSYKTTLQRLRRRKAKNYPSAQAFANSANSSPDIGLSTIVALPSSTDKQPNNPQTTGDSKIHQELAKIHERIERQVNRRIIQHEGPLYTDTSTNHQGNQNDNVKK